MTVAALLLPREVRGPDVQVAPGVGEDDGLPEAVVDEPPRTTWQAALRVPAYRAALAGNLATGFAVLGARSTVIPLFVVQGLELGPGWIGASFTVAALTQAVLLLPAGRAVDDLGRRPTLLAGGVLTSVSLGLLALADGPAGLIGSTIVFAAGAALLGVAPAALVGDVVEGRGGTAIAVWQMASDLGSVLGPLAVGLAVERGSFGLALWGSAAVVALCTLPALRVPAVSRHPQ
jgi:MFS family permease